MSVLIRIASAPGTHFCKDMRKIFIFCLLKILAYGYELYILHTTVDEFTLERFSQLKCIDFFCLFLSQECFSG